MTHSADKTPDNDQQQLRDLALVAGHTAAVQRAASRLHDDPTADTAISEMQLLLGMPSALARSALDRLQGRNRSRQGLRLVVSADRKNEEGDL